MPPLDQFRVRDKLFEILKTAGATETVFAPKQILSYIGKYIELKKLHDAKNIRIVRCKGDPLEDIFGVEEFVIGTCKDIWNSILPHLVPALARDSTDGENRAESSENNDNKDNIVTKLEHSWMTQLPWWYFIQKPEKALTSTGSVADNSTAVVKDTEYSDSYISDSVRVLSHDERFSVEFEPDSASSGSETDSDDTEPVYSDDEMTYSAPSIPFTGSSESTVTDDYWECAICPNMNPPTVGYCQRCWKFRANWWKASNNDTNPLKSASLTQISEINDVPLLPRWSSDPQGVDVADGKRTKRTRSPSLDDAGNSKKPALERDDTLTFMSQLDNVPSSSSQPIASNPAGTDPPSTKKTHELSSSNSHSSVTESNLQSLEQGSTNGAPQLSSIHCTTSQQQPSDVAVEASESHCNGANFSKNNYTSLPFNKRKTAELPGICNICRSHVNDASFVHGRSGHQYCCYRCAMKVLKKDGRCPVCREPIEIVIKNYIYQM